MAAAVVALALVAGAAVGLGLSRSREQARVQAEASASAALAARVLAQDSAARGAEVARAGRAVGDAARDEARDALLAAVEQGVETLDASDGEVADEAVRDALADVLQRAQHALESTPADAAPTDVQPTDDAAPADPAPTRGASGQADGSEQGAAGSSDGASVAALRALAAEVVAAHEAVRTAHDEWLAERKAQREREARATQRPRAPGGGSGGDRCETTYDGPPFYTSPPTKGGDGSNGKLPESMLRATSWGVDPKGTRYWLRTEATQALERLNVAFKAEFGHDLDLDLTYRDFATQVAMREALGSIAAVPGTSKHGTGYALDVPELPCEYGWDTPQRAWLVANGPSYGWVQPSWALRNGSNPEYWHYEYVG
ncbi:hypothetical protein CPE01_21780 [Cellulomonas persica]|uniref:D-alanyl-D-alanine carboxypeptidase-like core domain-containing protein n=1 Tax=Cellulomonas persica TaxID=76861 RepID=A0A510V042_9CELL|nr:hypothetical protein CPE01_21780 [Cellulomonas persica]